MNTMSNKQPIEFCFFRAEYRDLENNFKGYYRGLQTLSKKFIIKDQNTIDKLIRNTTEVGRTERKVGKRKIEIRFFK